MVIHLTDKEGRQIRELRNLSADFEPNDGERDFQLTIPTNENDVRMKYGCRIFIPNTEFGGILGSLEVATASEHVIWKGYCWRGCLAKKIIEPPSGEDYLIVSGELNTILKSLIEPRFDGVFKVSEIDTGIRTNYQFKRYCTLLDGLNDMLAKVGYRLSINYREGEPNGSGFVEVQAVPIANLSDQIELSQDSQLNFKMSEQRNGINHLIVLGKGELQNRTVIHLYAQADGSISKSISYTGINELVDVYENTSAEDSELETEGIQRFQEIMNKKTFEMDVEKLGIDVAIGDIVGGRDDITGLYMAKPVSNIILKIENEIISKEYKLEG